MTASLRQAAQMALDAMEHHQEQTRPIAQTAAAIESLRAALAVPDEPVAPSPTVWVDAGKWTRADRIAYMDANQWAGAPQPVPVERQPLTDDAIDAMTIRQFGEMAGYPLQQYRSYARSIEHASRATA